jgi:hypothetical protein
VLSIKNEERKKERKKEDEGWSYSSVGAAAPKHEVKQTVENK